MQSVAAKAGGRAPARQERVARWWTLGLPLGLSLIVHGVLGVVVASVAWRLSVAPEEAPGGEAFIATGPLVTAEERAPSAEPITPAEGPEAPRVQAAASKTDGGAKPSSRREESAASRPPAAPVRVESSTAAAVAGTGGDVTFAGLSAQRATSVAYVVDGSAPMLGTMPSVMAEVIRSAGALLATQQFSVVVFRNTGGEGSDGSTGLTTFSPRLVDATARNRGRLADWLRSIEPKGQSNPLEGLRAALQLKPRPQVVFLLSHSIQRSHGGQWENGREAILRELDALNPADPATGRRKTVIKTLQFLEPDPTGTMQAIGEAHGSGGPAGAGGAAGSGARGHRVLKREDLPLEEPRR